MAFTSLAAFSCAGRSSAAPAFPGLGGTRAPGWVAPWRAVGQQQRRQRAGLSAGARLAGTDALLRIASERITVTQVERERERDDVPRLSGEQVHARTHARAGGRTPRGRKYTGIFTQTDRRIRNLPW